MNGKDGYFRHSDWRSANWIGISDNGNQVATISPVQFSDEGQSDVRSFAAGADRNSDFSRVASKESQTIPSQSDQLAHRSTFSLFSSRIR